MQRSDAVLLGRDYSAREFTPEELKLYQQQNPNDPPIQALGRYIGYPSNAKCISHYPGAYKAHWESGRPVFLFHQIGYTDMGGGYDAGRGHAQVAVNDARSSAVGWNGESPIVACFDRYYIKKDYPTLTREQLRSYMEGYRSVVGFELSGFYGFYDSMRHCVEEAWANFKVQCGAREHHVPGIDAWQENNFQPKIFGTGTDILEIYRDPFGVDMLDRNRDYPELLAMLQRAFFFDLRPKGSGEPGQTFEAGPSIFEMFNILLSKQVADVDEAALADELAKRGVGGVDVAKVKEALTEVLSGTKLTPPQG